MNDERTLFRPAPTHTIPTASGGQAIFAEEDEERASLVEVLGFAIRAARRRFRLSLLVFFVGLGLTALAARLVPRTYESYGRILVVRTPTTASFGGAAAGGFNPDDAKREAKEFEQQIYARSNLEGIVKEARLVERWAEMRSPLRRLVDELGEATGAATPSDEEKLDVLVRTLEKAIKVIIDGSAVAVSVEWPEAFAARDIAAACLKRFQDTRYAVEVAVYPQAIGVLEGHVKEAREAMAAAAVDAQEERARKGTGEAPRPSGRSRSNRDPAVEARLADVRSRIQELTDHKRARLAQLENQLAELSGTYGPAHPAIVALKTTIESTRRDTPEVAALKEKEAELLAQRRSAQSRTVEIDEPSANAKPSDGLLASGTEYASAADRFEAAQRRYEALVGRIETASIERQVAEATFKTKYVVVRPAELPLGTKKPVVMMVLVAGVLGSLLLVLVAAYGADALAGIFYEPKRVRDVLALPVLGEASLD